MKVIEKIITYEDYNYVEGTLQFKAYGKKTHDLINAEYFSIDRISHVHLEVEKKYLPPKLPPGINKNKVSTLTLPDKITTIIDGNYSKPYSITYDEIIVDDSYVDDNQNIKGPRFNSTKVGSELSSTVAIKIYGLIKIERQRTETENQFEITVIPHGPGKIVVSPHSESYRIGDKVKITAIPNEKSIFVGYRNKYKRCNQDFEIQIEEKDIIIEADFIHAQQAEEALNSNNENNFTKDNLKTIQDGLNEFIRKENRTYPQKLKENWDNTTINKKSIGVEAKGFWEILGFVLFTIFYVIILIFLIAIFGKGLLVIGLVLLIFWIFNRIAPFVFSWRGIQWIFGFIICSFLITGLLNIISNYNSAGPYINELADNSNIKTKEVINENTTIEYVHHISWYDYDENRYELDLIINSDLVQNATNYKNNYPAVNTETAYSGLLKNLHQKSITDDYIRVIEKLDSIRKAKNINEMQFAKVVVSMVQSIPYYAIVQETCNPYSYQDPAIRELLMRKPCEPNVRFGIKTPAEFLKDLKGDCDSRTLFLYGLLKSYGYDVAIFGSQKYKHSILGISLNIEKPHFKILNNKKYYLWEVTEKNYRPGLLPNQIANLNYWNINLN